MELTQSPGKRVRVLDFVVVGTQPGFKNVSCKFYNILIKSQVVIAANHFVRGSMKKKSLCLP